MGNTGEIFDTLARISAMTRVRLGRKPWPSQPRLHILTCFHFRHPEAGNVSGVQPILTATDCFAAQPGEDSCSLLSGNRTVPSRSSWVYPYHFWPAYTPKKISLRQPRGDLLGSIGVDYGRAILSNIDCRINYGWLLREFHPSTPVHRGGNIFLAPE